MDKSLSLNSVENIHYIPTAVCIILVEGIKMCNDQLHSSFKLKVNAQVQGAYKVLALSLLAYVYALRLVIGRRKAADVTLADLSPRLR